MLLLASSLDTAQRVVYANPAFAAEVKAYVFSPVPESGDAELEARTERRDAWTPPVSFASECPEGR